MKIGPVALIVDDEKQMRRLLRLALESEQFRVFDAETGEEALSEAVYRRPDVIVLDLGLPDMEGVEVLHRLREWSRVPILILSVRDDPDEKVAALDAGADDYVTKPFSTAELLARLRVIQRRSLAEVSEPVFECGPLRVNLAMRRVTVNEMEVSLTGTEYAILRILVQHAGKVVTQKQLLRTVWGEKAENQAQYIRVHITHLRQKLESADAPRRLIKTETGIGYRLCVNQN